MCINMKHTQFFYPTTSAKIEERYFEVYRYDTTASILRIYQTRMCISVYLFKINWAWMSKRTVRLQTMGREVFS